MWMYEWRAWPQTLLMVPLLSSLRSSPSGLVSVAGRRHEEESQPKFTALLIGGSQTERTDKQAGNCSWRNVFRTSTTVRFQGNFTVLLTSNPESQTHGCVKQLDWSSQQTGLQLWGCQKLCKLECLLKWQQICQEIIELGDSFSTTYLW